MDIMIRLKHLILENLDESLLELVQDAQSELMEMWKVADDSVSDYTVEIETAVNFLSKALRTQDRLDIFKALQKAYDVLEREEETFDDEEQDGYDNLVDRIRAVIQ